MISRWFAQFKTKILLLSVATTSVVAVSLSGYLIFTQFRALDLAFLEQGSATAREIAAISAPYITSKNIEALKAYTKQIYQRADALSVTITDSKGDILIADVRKDAPVQTDSVIAKTFSAPILSDRQLLDHSIPDERQKEMQLGLVTVTLIDHYSTDNRHQIIINSLLVLLFGLVISGLLAVWLGRKIYAPIDRLTRAVTRMKHGDFTTRVPLSPHGEIRNLEEGFNAMADELEHSRRELQNQIQQTTTDLSQTLEALELQNIEFDLARKRALETSKKQLQNFKTLDQEIRIPVSHINRFTQFLSETNLSVEQSDAVKNISKSAFDIVNTFDNLFYQSQADNKQQALLYEAFNLRESFEQIVNIFAPNANDKGVELVLLIFSDVPEIFIGDEPKIRKVLINLISNAIKFTAQGSVVIRVMLDDPEEDESLCFTVTDTGPGISEELKQQFVSHSNNHLESVKYTDKLGLAICRQLVQTMNGKITADNNEEQGSVFCVTLPLKSGSQADSTPSKLHFSNTKCLLQDQHRLARLATQHKLQSFGVEVWDEIPSTPGTAPDFIVLGFSSKELFSGAAKQSIAKVRKQFDLPLLILASTSMPNLLLELSKNASAQCIPKPVTTETLLYAVQNCLHSLNGNTSTDKHEAPSPPVLSTTGLSILVADDNKINLELITAILKEWGIKVTPAHDGLEALEWARNQLFDLILMDIHMPNLNGLDAAKQIRLLDEDRDCYTKIIALTADTLPGTQEKIKDAGIDDYLTKPIDQAKLLKLIETNIHDGQVDIRSDDHHSNTHALRDIDAALKISGGNAVLADDLYTQLCQDLPWQLKLMQKQFTASKWSALQTTIHRLHGATAVCGVPALQNAAKELEMAINGAVYDRVESLLAQLKTESERLLAAFEANATE